MQGGFGSWAAIPFTSAVACERYAFELQWESFQDTPAHHR